MKAYRELEFKDSGNLL